jgi:hypothetical protein
LPLLVDERRHDLRLVVDASGPAEFDELIGDQAGDLIRGRPNAGLQQPLLQLAKPIGNVGARHPHPSRSPSVSG